MLDREEFQRWYAQAEHTMASSRRDAGAGDHDWACFKAQQAAELALKALLRAMGRPAMGHGLLHLLDRIANEGVSVDADVAEAARNLEFHYIPARYPYAFPTGAPYQYYGRDQADQAIAAAARVLTWVAAVVGRA